MRKEEEKMNIRQRVINKIDKVLEGGPPLQFITKKGWLSITKSSNTETIKWVLNKLPNHDNTIVAVCQKIFFVHDTSIFGSTGEGN